MLINKDGKAMIEVHSWPPPGDAGPTVYGVVWRKVTESKTYWANISGERVCVVDPHGACYSFVNKLPKDLDTRGYE